MKWIVPIVGLVFASVPATAAAPTPYPTYWACLDVILQMQAEGQNVVGLDCAGRGRGWVIVYHHKSVLFK